jgi:hypothetical protein
MTAGSQAPTGRVIGFASAVLLVLLLATSGWPQGSTPPPEAPPVACSVAQHPAVAFAAAEPQAPAFSIASGRRARGPEPQAARFSPRPQRRSRRRAIPRRSPARPHGADPSLNSIRPS